jgi:hypothetical protein
MAIFIAVSFPSRAIVAHPAQDRGGPRRGSEMADMR